MNELLLIIITYYIIAILCIIIVLNLIQYYTKNKYKKGHLLKCLFFGILKHTIKKVLFFND